MINVLITGDSKGLGRKICIDMSKYSNFIVNGLSRGNVNESWNHIVFDLVKDDVSSLKNVLANTDVLIHNAAIPSSNIAIVEPIRNYEKVMRLNFYSPVEITQAWLKERIKKKKSGTVIFISSICTKRHFKGLSAYACSKSALNTYAKTVAKEMGGRGFQSIVVLPGYMETDMTSEMKGDKIEKIKKITPMKRLSKLSEVSDVICALAKNPSFINGSEIVVDGGFIL